MDKLWPRAADGNRGRGCQKTCDGETKQCGSRLMHGHGGEAGESHAAHRGPPRWAPAGAAQAHGPVPAAVRDAQPCRVSSARPQEAVQLPAFGTGAGLSWTRLENLGTALHPRSRPCPFPGHHGLDLRWLKQQRRCRTELHRVHPPPARQPAGRAAAAEPPFCHHTTPRSPLSRSGTAGQQAITAQALAARSEGLSYYECQTGKSLCNNTDGHLFIVLS